MHSSQVDTGAAGQRISSPAAYYFFDTLLSSVLGRLSVTQITEARDQARYPAITSTQDSGKMHTKTHHRELTDVQLNGVVGGCPVLINEVNSSIRITGDGGGLSGPIIEKIIGAILQQVAR